MISYRDSKKYHIIGQGDQRISMRNTLQLRDILCDSSKEYEILLKVYNIL